jgi:putative transposase
MGAPALSTGELSALRRQVRRRKLIALHRGPDSVPVGSTEHWSMDVVHDTLAERRPFRILTVVDHWIRQSPVLQTGFRMSGETVGLVPDRVLNGTQGPRSITVDHGTEFQPRALEEWAYRRACRSTLFGLATSWRISLIESFNGRLRVECLNVHQFSSLIEAHHIIEAWRLDGNQRGSHSSLGHLTPNECAGHRQVIQAAADAICTR